MIVVICATDNKRDRTQPHGRGGVVGTTWLQRRLARLGVLARGEGGNSAIEFALAAPILLGLLVPLVDLGLAFSKQIEVQQAAQAGAQYALLHGYDSTAIANAVTAATTLTLLPADPVTNPAPSQRCACPTGTAIGPQVSCGSSCADGEFAGSYVFVSAQSAYTPPLPYSVLGSSVTLTALAAVRVQ